jgi:hypothetical protein
MLAPPSAGEQCLLVIAGPSGIGKSSLALKYANEAFACGKYSGGAFILDFPNDGPEGSFAEAIASFATVLKVTRQADTRETAKAVVRDLSSGENSLLIVDNVQDLDLWARIRSAGLLPSDRCSILVTTQHDHLGAADIVRLPYLSLQETVQLWSTFRPDAAEEKFLPSVESVAKKCGGLPFLARMLGILMKVEGPSYSWDALAKSLISVADVDKLSHRLTDDEKFQVRPNHTLRAVTDSLISHLSDEALAMVDLLVALRQATLSIEWLEAVFVRLPDNLRRSRGKLIASMQAGLRELGRFQFVETDRNIVHVHELFVDTVRLCRVRPRWSDRLVASALENYLNVWSENASRLFVDAEVASTTAFQSR